MSKTAQAKLIVALILLAGIAGVLGYALIIGSAATVLPGNYYPLAVGNSWTYSISPGTKIYEENVTQSMQVGGCTAYAVVIDETYSYMGKIGGSIYQFGQGEPGNPKNLVVFNPPQLSYPQPFVVGNDWEASVPSEAMVKTSDMVYVTGTVEAKESVTVPAGTFNNSVKVLVDDPRDSPSEQTEIWFAANVGIIKTITYTVIGNRPATTSTTELVKYKSVTRICLESICAPPLHSDAGVD